jgi:hypothetical protein
MRSARRGMQGWWCADGALLAVLPVGAAWRLQVVRAADVGVCATAVGADGLMVEHSFWYWLGLTFWRYRWSWISYAGCKALVVVLALTVGLTPFLVSMCIGLFIVTFPLALLHAYQQEW